MDFLGISEGDQTAHLDAMARVALKLTSGLPGDASRPAASFLLKQLLHRR